MFTSTATQNGGQESTTLSFHTLLLHLGFVVVGLPYSFAGQNGVSEVMGNSPYGASTLADGDGSRKPSPASLPPDVSAARVFRLAGRQLSYWMAAALRRSSMMFDGVA